VVSSAKDEKYICSHTSLLNHVSEVETYVIGFISRKSYSLKKENGKYVTVDGNGQVQIEDKAAYFEAFSDT
jgi:phospholipase C